MDQDCSAKNMDILWSQADIHVRTCRRKPSGCPRILEYIDRNFFSNRHNNQIISVHFCKETSRFKQWSIIIFGFIWNMKNKAVNITRSERHALRFVSIRTKTRTNGRAITLYPCVVHSYTSLPVATCNSLFQCRRVIDTENWNHYNSQFYKNVILTTKLNIKWFDFVLAKSVTLQ